MFRLLIIICLVASGRLWANPQLEPDDNERFSIDLLASDENCTEYEFSTVTESAACFGAELTGTIQHINVENHDEGFDQGITDYEAVPVFKASFPLASKTYPSAWQANVVFEGEKNKEESKTTEALLTLMHTESEFGVFVGLTDLGGIDQGNDYMTALGQDILGSYGNWGESQSYVGVLARPSESLLVMLAYAADLDEFPFEGELPEPDVDQLNMILEWEVEDLTVAAEYEFFSYGHSDLDDDYAYGISLAYEWDAIQPFLNYGVSSFNDEAGQGNKVDTTEVNFGLDMAFDESWGLTVAAEWIQDDRRFDEGLKSDDIKNLYAGIQYFIGIAHIGLSYWRSDQIAEQDNDNIKQQIDLELGLVF